MIKAGDQPPYHVRVFKHEKQKQPDGSFKYDRVMDFDGLFHTFSQNFMQMYNSETGLPGTYVQFPTALISKGDGTVVQIDPANIEFL